MIISTHAPRTGSDLTWQTCRIRKNRFQPTLPARGATPPRTRRRWARCYFNPRSPHGERRCAMSVKIVSLLFQPTLPARGATCTSHSPLASVPPFQPTLPARGATIIASLLSTRKLHFNPRSPHGERRYQGVIRTAKQTHFNPRSPHGERLMVSIRVHRLPLTNFNPRSPHGERPKHGGTRIPGKDISTHAPRTGSDGFIVGTISYIDISTHAPRTGSDSAKQQFCRPESEALHKKYTIKQSF